VTMRRRKVLPQDPNSLFLGWLKEWEEEARNKGKLPLAKIYNHCQQNLAKYPLPLENGLQCKIIVGFGKGICAQLEEKLQKHRMAKSDSREQTLSTSVEMKTGSFENSSLNSRSSNHHRAEPSRLPSFPVSPVAVKSPPLQPVENLPTSSARSPVRLKPFPGSPPEPKSLQEKQIISFQHSKQSSLASVFDSPPSSGKEEEGKRAVLGIMGSEESLEERERRDLEQAIALSQAETSGQSQFVDSDFEMAKRLQQELDQEEAANERRALDELPDVEDHIIEREKMADDIEDEELELALHLSQQEADDHKLALSLSEEMGGGRSDSEFRCETLIEAAMHCASVEEPSKRSPERRGSDEENEWASEPLQEFFRKNKVFSGTEGVVANRGRGVGGGKSKGETNIDVESTNGSKRKRKAETGHDSPSSVIKKKGTSERKEYVPKSRSGAYAVLLTLVKEEEEDSWQGYLSKGELQAKAQPLCDESLTHRSVHREHYSAWSSVKTLLKHELVTKWSNPAKFKVTDKGRQLAVRILRMEKGGFELSDGLADSHLEEKNNSSDDDDDMRRAKNLSMQSLQADFSLGSSFASDFSPEPVVKSNGGSSSSQSNAFVKGKAQSDRSEVVAPLPGTSKQSLSRGQKEPTKSTSLPSKTATVAPSSNKATESIASTRADSLPLPMRLQEMARQASQSARPIKDTFTPQFKLSRGRFDILLCVDNTETTGGGAGGRKSLKTETVRHLKNAGVQYDQRGLNIGDFLWVAREKLQEVGGQFTQPKPRELVLPFLVERKRQDDLWASVKDGRYDEQKFRMKNSGLEHLFYLVEDHPTKKEFWGKSAGGVDSGEAMEQAIANTAAQEGFSVKRTTDQRGSIEYLTLMTRLLKEKYKDEELMCITRSDLEEGKVRSRDTALLDFQAFNEASKKSKKLTVREVFAKTLMRMKGLSVDMAQGIVAVYPCPALLRNALLDVPESARLALLTNIKIGIEGKRKVPKAIAEAVIKFWMSDSLV